jgi:hypothetical protein
VSELKPDMMVEATIVTTADAGAASATATPPMVGTLLVAKGASADDMPAAGTNLPLYGIIGAMMLIMGFWLRMSGRKPVRQV